MTRVVLKMLPDIFIYLYFTVIAVSENFAHTPNNYYAFAENLNYSFYTNKPAHLKTVVTTVRPSNNVLDAKHYDSKTVGKSEESNEEKPSDNILNEMLQYSDVVSSNLQDYIETPIDLHSETGNRNPVVSSSRSNMVEYNKNVSKLRAIEKSKAKENDEESSETDSLEAVDKGLEYTKLDTSTEYYENEIIKSLIPILNLSVKLNESKRFELENKNILPKEQILEKVNSLHKSKQSKELIVRDHITYRVNKDSSSTQPSNDIMKINNFKIFGDPIIQETNIGQKDTFEHHSKTTSNQRLLINVTPSYKHPNKASSDYIMKSINQSKLFAQQKRPPIKSKNITDAVNTTKTKAHFDTEHNKVEHAPFSNETISNNSKTTNTPSTIAKNNTTVLKVLSNIVEQLTNILSSSSEIVTKSYDKVTSEFKSYQIPPKNESGFSSSSSNIAYFNNNIKMNKTIHKDKITKNVKQNNIMISRQNYKDREKIKKKSETKQRNGNTKVNKSVKSHNILHSKAENTRSVNKSNTNQSHMKSIKKIKNITIPRDLQVSNPITNDEEEIKTPNQKDLDQALHIFDTYTKVLNSNKIKAIFYDKPESDHSDESIIEDYEDHVKRLESKNFAAETTQNIDEIENNRHDKKSSGVIEKCGVRDSNFTLDKDLTRTSIENFPWLGVLCYRESKHMRRFTNVILVTKNMVVAAAVDIYKIPKTNFRQRSKVVLGHPCNYQPGFRVLEYRYHPEYGKTTSSSIALVQLDVAVEKVLHPISGNPTKLIKPQFYAIVLPDMCKRKSIKIYHMNQLDLNLCRSYYDGIGLNTASVWPKHALCGIALHRSGGCVWRNGVALVVKQDHRWNLIGFGVNGPGCGIPSRFVDYSAYSGWVADSAARVGRPALTRLADNHLVLRRSNRVLQRHGACDPFEKKTVLYTNHYETTKFDDEDSIKKSAVFKYNITLHPSYDYSCIDIRASSSFKVPLITVKRYHQNQTAYNRLDFVYYSLKAYFSNALDINITAYGKKTKELPNTLC